MGSVRFTQGNRWRVSTPAFPECDRMDDFYAEAHRVIETEFTSLTKKARRGVCVADFAVSEEEADTVVTLRLRIRENGKVTAKKTVAHRWRGGNIAPRERAFFPFNIISKHRRKRKTENERDENIR